MPKPILIRGLKTLGFGILVLISCLWFALALWMQQPLPQWLIIILIGSWSALALSTLLFPIPKLRWAYFAIFGIGLLWYLSLQPQQHRNWNPEVAQMLHYQRQGDLINLSNVRDFRWQSNGDYQIHWQKRQINLNHITGVNILTSYWMGPDIAHTLVSFDFKDQAPLSFSIEIRKEQHEDFSALGGFFRKYELSLVAANETDLVYTRSHVRGEQVYLFPIDIPHAMQKQLLLQYLAKADQLAKQPQWYNTLTSNCTTLVFDMAQLASGHQLPLDYRLLASGYLPNYLYDLGLLDQRWDLATWYQQAYIDPKKVSFEHYSEQIRQFPKP